MGNSCFKPEVADKEQPVVAPEATQEVNKYQQLVDRLRNLTTLMVEKQLKQQIFEQSKVEYNLMKEEPFLKDIYVAKIMMLKKRRDNANRYYNMLQTVISNLNKIVEMIRTFENDSITASFVQDNLIQFKSIYKAATLIEDLKEMTREHEEVEVQGIEMSEQDNADFSKYLSEIDPSYTVADVISPINTDLSNILPTEIPATTTTEQSANVTAMNQPATVAVPISSQPQINQVKMAEVEVDY